MKKILMLFIICTLVCQTIHAAGPQRRPSVSIAAYIPKHRALHEPFEDHFSNIAIKGFIGLSLTIFILLLLKNRLQQKTVLIITIFS